MVSSNSSGSSNRSNIPKLSFLGTNTFIAHSFTTEASQQSAGWWSVVTLDRAEITWSNEADSDFIRSNRDKMLHFTLHCPLCPQPSDR